MDHPKQATTIGLLAFLQTPSGKRIERMLLVVLALIGLYLAVRLIFVLFLSSYFPRINLVELCQQKQENAPMFVEQCPNGDIVVTPASVDPTNPLAIPFSEGIKVYNQQGFLVRTFGKSSQEVTFFSWWREKRQQSSGCQTTERINYCK